MSAERNSLAVVLASHGDRGGTSPNAALHRQAEAVRALTGLTVLTAMLKGEPTIEQAVADASVTGAARVAVYPLFMADGYFVHKVRERVQAAGLAPAPLILPPLGLDPGLPDILLQEALAAASTAAFDAAASRLLIVGHGSKLGPASATATRKAAARVALARRFTSVTTAFLEEEPFVEDALRASTAPTIVAGFFFGDGMHAGEDVPDAIAETGVNAVYTGAIGNSPAVATLIANAITPAVSEPNS